MTSILSTIPQLSGVDLFANNTTAQMPVGTYVETADGRGFRYSKIGAVATAAGKLYQSAAADAVNLTPVGGLGVSAAQAIGDTSVTISTSTTLTANQLAGSYLITDVTPGQGYTYLIAGNTATTAAVGAVITLSDPLKVALTTASKVVVAQHPYLNVVVYPTTATGMAAGVAQNVISAASFGWLQTFGITNVLSGVATGITAGVPVAPSTATAGAVTVATAVLPTIGWAVQAFTATEYQGVYLDLH